MCNYVYDNSKETVEFSNLMKDWRCPKCRAPRDFYKPRRQTVAGFAENKSYGFGFNEWTEAGKSNLIFGGFAAFFALFLGGYAMN